MKKDFLTKHRELRSGEFFQFFRSTNVTETSSLINILSNAHTNNNRSRSVCVELGWLKKDGTLADSAPDQIKLSYNRARKIAAEIKNSAFRVIRESVIKNGKVY